MPEGMGASHSRELRVMRGGASPVSPNAAAIVLIAASALSHAQPSVPGMTTSLYGSYPTTYLPLVLIFDDAGYLYASADDASSPGQRIRRVPPGGGLAAIFSNSQIYDPDGLLLDRHGVISGVPGAILMGCGVSGSPTGQIRALRPDGTDFTVSGPSSILNNCGPLEFDSSNRVFIAVFGNRTIVRFTGTTPSLFLTLPGTINSGGLLIDSIDRIWVSCSDGAVRRYLPSAALEATITVGGIYPGMGINRHQGSFAEGVYVSNRSTGIMSRIGAGEVLEPVGTGFSTPTHLLFDSDGALYNSDYSLGRIWKTECIRITDQPASASTCPNGSAMFSITAEGASALMHQWEAEIPGSPGTWRTLMDGSNAFPGLPMFLASGASTPMLTVLPSNDEVWNQPLRVRAVITNTCGQATSNTAMLTVCIADTDDGTGSGMCDGGVTIEDLLHYLSIFDAGLLAADVDDGSGRGVPDGGVTIEDLLYFLARFDAGC